MKNLSQSLRRIFFVITAIGLFLAAGMDEIVSDIWDSLSKGSSLNLTSPSTPFLTPIPEESSLDFYPVDAIFETFYNTLGGEKILGPVISPAFVSGSEIYQYVESGLMEFDGRKVPNDRFSFAPLGIQLNEEINSTLNSAGQSNQFEIFQDFILIYRRLGGAQFVGKPLGPPEFNLKENRIEQYFENLGFYKSGQSDTVHLIPYGAYACDMSCRHQDRAANIPRLDFDLPEPYIRVAARIGADVIGRALSPPYVAADGLEEVIFENLVLARDLRQPDLVYIRSISETLGIERQQLVRRIDDPLLVFFPVEKNLGYNVPGYFVDYIKTHGGFIISGMPIGEVYSPQEGVFRQCFTNLCLEFNLNVSAGDKLYPMPLGVSYKALVEKSVFDFRISSSLESVDLKAWELLPVVSPHDSQVIRVGIFQHGYPLVNREPVLFLKLPGNGLKVIYMPPTSGDGITEVQLEPIQAPIGTLISYDVCLFGPLNYRTCKGDNYLIWNYD